MYLPKPFIAEDMNILHDFIDRYSFGTLCTHTAEGLFANHFPFLLDREPSNGILWTHMARNNPQWQQLKKDGTCLAIFQGPHAYISPTIYVEKLNVPTWNYTSVHVHCVAEVYEDFETIEGLLARTVEKFERSNSSPWKYELPEDFRRKLVQAIVGIKLNVGRVEGKFKLSQNRSAEDYQAVFDHFSARTDDNSQELFQLMKSTRPAPLR